MPIFYPGFSTDLEKWRLTYRGGRHFIDRYLQKHSTRETEEDFIARRSATYCPAFAKAEVNNVKNSIYQRMVDIVRETNCPSYNTAITGKNGGVDKNGSTMNRFIGVTVLQELLPMGRVGIYVDMPSNIGLTKLDQQKVKPYLYIYQRENILLAETGEDGEYNRLVLQDKTVVYDDNDLDSLQNQELATATRTYTRVNGVVTCKITSKDSEGQSVEKVIVLDIPYIPFVMVSLTHSLLEDIADYQISLLNIESGDLDFIRTANFPFYVEQFNPMTELTAANLNSWSSPGGTTDPKDGQRAQAEAGGKTKELTVGIRKGRRIEKNLDYPEFIAPPTDCMQASMAKQEQMKRDIKTLLNQSLSSLKNERSSADSKRQDQTGEEEGLSYIGLELNNAERKVAFFWCLYEGVANPEINIQYPENYELRSYTDRLAEAKEIIALTKLIPSETYRREMLKLAATTLLKNRASLAVLDKIATEIDKVELPISLEPKELDSFVERGVISKVLAAKAIGAPEGDVAVAEEEHVQRAAAIALAQSQVNQAGTKELLSDPNSQKLAKEGHRDSSTNRDGQSQVRGAGK